MFFGEITALACVSRIKKPINILGGELSETAFVKLMWVLGRTQDPKVDKTKIVKTSFMMLGKQITYIINFIIASSP